MAKCSKHRWRDPYNECPSCQYEEQEEHARLDRIRRDTEWEIEGLESEMEGIKDGARRILGKEGYSYPMDDFVESYHLMTAAIPSLSNTSDEDEIKNWTIQLSFRVYKQNIRHDFIYRTTQEESFVKKVWLKEYLKLRMENAKKLKKSGHAVDLKDYKKKEKKEFNDKYDELVKVKERSGGPGLLFWIIVILGILFLLMIFL
ncbi:hypothetical protein ACFLRC_04450 [Candidatus Altiarchaeota archaeon]